MIFPPRKKAFTLIEILIVLTIIGLLTVLLLPNYGMLQQQSQLRIVTDQVEQLFHQAKVLSQSGYKENIADENIAVTGIYIDKNTNTLSLFSAPFSADPIMYTITNKIIKQVPTGNIIIRKLYSETEQDNEISTMTILFYPPFGDIIIDTNNDGTTEIYKKITMEFGIKQENTSITKKMYFSPLTHRIDYEE